MRWNVQNHDVTSFMLASNISWLLNNETNEAEGRQITPLPTLAHITLPEENLEEQDPQGLPWLNGGDHPRSFQCQKCVMHRYL